jgi:hypothetical protein
MRQLRLLNSSYPRGLELHAMESGSAGIQSRCIIIFLIVRYGMGGAHVSFFFERQNDAVLFSPAFSHGL